MAQIDFHRAAYSRPNPNLACGKAKPAPVLTRLEAAFLAQCRHELAQAATATTNNDFIRHLTEVHRLTKKMVTNRFQVIK